MKKILLLITVSLCFFSCTKDFIEPDISDDTLKILAPADSVSTSVSSITFWWEELEGARTYRIQIVKPSFSNVQLLIADTAVEGDKIIWSFSPGTYQWRIRAENSISSTSYITRTFTIDSTLDLSTQTVILTSPANNALLKDQVVSLQWNNLYNATNYRLQISSLSSGALLVDDTISNNLYTTTLSEGSYSWSVRAQNATSVSSYSSRTFTIDTTPPTVSSFIVPAINQTLTAMDTIKWSRFSGTVKDSIEIVTDTLLLTSPTRTEITTPFWYHFQGLPGNYFIRIKSADQAGNWSNFSTPWRRFSQQ